MLTTSIGLLLLLLARSYASIPCASRTLSPGHTICVCNQTYCDDVAPVGTLRTGEGALYVSTEAGRRLERTQILAQSHANKILLTVDPTRVFQEIKGFGGAFTDSAGINLKKLPQVMQDGIINGYYGQNGLGYTIGRVPMASCDFSTHEYSYADVAGDMSLSHFNLTSEDFDYKIPYIKQAMSLTSNLKLFASPWSSPGWMKTNDDMRGGGLLDGPIDGPYYTTWAKYFIKFFEEYHKEGIDFWGLTSQNEPTTGRVKKYKWQTMYFNASMQRDFIKTLLGPALKASPVTKNLKLMILDDQRFNLPHWADVVLSDPAAAQFVSGVALHWYEDSETPSAALLETHNHWPNYFMLATEACTGYMPLEGKPILGSWLRGELYAHDIITDLNNWVTGWTDWNLCLDMAGGPNWVGNTVDAPIIIDETKNEYYKQPMWHALGHFSKFMLPGSLRVETELVNLPGGIEQVAFVTPQGQRGIVIMNRGTSPHDISVNDVHEPNKYYSFTLEQKSIITLVYN